MSDRRERVARAMYDADANHYDIDWFWSEMTQKEREPWFRFADAALAVIDAEPTEAEIEATCPECGGHGRGCSFCGGTGDWPRTSEPTEAEIIAAREMWFRLPDDMTADECMRRVLIAARTARQGGQG